MWVSGKMIIFMAKEFIISRTGINMKDHIYKTILMEKESFHMLAEIFMRAISKMM